MNNIMYNIFAFCTILLQTLTILINTVQNQTISDNMPQKYLLLYIILLTRLLAIKIASSSCSIQSSYSSSESSAAAPPLPASCHRRIPGSTGQESWPGPPGWQWPVVHTTDTCELLVYNQFEFVFLSHEMMQANLKYSLQLDSWSSLRQLSINLQRQAIPVCWITGMHVLPSIMILFLDNCRAKSPILQVLVRSWPVCGWCHIYIMIRECIYQHHLLTCICYCWSLTISSFSKVTAAAWHRRFLAQSCMSVLSEKLIAFLCWIIYLAAFKTCASLAQEVFYNTKVAHLKAAWRCRDHGGGRSSSFRSKPGTTVKGTSTRHASNELLPRTSSSERSRKFRNSHAPT